MMFRLQDMPQLAASRTGRRYREIREVDGHSRCKKRRFIFLAFFGQRRAGIMLRTTFRRA